MTATGLVVGLFIGLLGGGGSILAVPLLVHGAALPVPAAIAGGLLLVATAAAAATVSHLRNGMVDGSVVAVFGTVGVVASYAGARLARHVDPKVQLALFALLMVFVGLRMLLAGERPAGGQSPRSSRLAIGATAVGVGLLTGLLGAGGGFVLVPAMMLFVGLPVRRAIGSSVAVLAITGTGALLGYLEQVSLPIGVWGPAAAVAAFAAAVGTMFARRVPEATLRRAFGALVLLIGLFQLLVK